MKRQRFEMEDPQGRYMTADYDKEQGLLMVTTYLYPKPDVSIEETLSQSGFKITSKRGVEKPKLVGINRKG